MASAGADIESLEAEIQAALLERPEHPGLLAALGGVRLQAGDVIQAVALLERAAHSAPGDVRILSDYGVALTLAGRLSEAELTLRMAMALDAGDDSLRFNLGRCLQLQKRNSEALSVLAAIKDLRDDVFKLRGDLYKELGDWRQAAYAYIQALQLNPENSAYLNDLGVLLDLNGNPREYRQLWEELASRPDAGAVVFYFLGNALRAEDEYELARQAYQRAVDLAPEMAEAYNNLALVLGKVGREGEAVVALRRAMEINPGLVAPQTNLGAIMSKSAAIDEAVSLLARAVALDPDSIDARVNYGAVLMRKRCFAESEREFRIVLAAKPGQALAELNLGLLLLSEGRLDEGWPYYESRWKMPQLAEKRPELATPQWDGRPLDGKTLFVYSEQGFGDNIQFSRYLLELRRRYPTVRLVFYAMHALTAVFQSSNFGEGIEFLPWGEPIPAHDFNIPSLSLPWRCATSVESIPSMAKYISADQVRAEEWQRRLPASNCPRIGLVWATSETFIYRSAKTIALSKLQPLLDTAGVMWVNLQFGADAKEIVTCQMSDRIFNPMDEVRDFADTAALIANLDLVISVDTAVAHLAGAMGKPVWMLDRFDTDWRWLPPREDSPWYPTMRIFRQHALGAWDGVVERVQAELKNFLMHGIGK